MLNCLSNNSDKSRQIANTRYLLYHTLGILDNQINYVDEFYLYKFSADICAESLKHSNTGVATEAAEEKSRASLYQKISARSHQKLVEKSRACRKIAKCLEAAESSNNTSRRNSLVYDLTGAHAIYQRERLIANAGAEDVSAINKVLNLDIADEKKLLNIYGGRISMSSVARYIESGRALTSPYFFNFVDIDIVIDADLVDPDVTIVGDLSGNSRGRELEVAARRIALLVYIFVRIHCYSATLICGNSRVSEAIQAEIAGLEKRGCVIKNNKHVSNKYVLRLDPRP